MCKSTERLNRRTTVQTTMAPGQPRQVWCDCEGGGWGGTWPPSPHDHPLHTIDCGAPAGWVGPPSLGLSIAEPRHGSPCRGRRWPPRQKPQRECTGLLIYLYFICHWTIHFKRLKWHIFCIFYHNLNIFSKRIAQASNNLFYQIRTPTILMLGNLEASCLTSLSLRHLICTVVLYLS